MTRTILQLKCLKRDTHELGASELSKDVTDDLIDELIDAKLIIGKVIDELDGECVNRAKSFAGQFNQRWGTK